MRKGPGGSLIFDERTTTLQDLIDLCQREFPGVSDFEIFFPHLDDFRYAVGDLQEHEIMICKMEGPGFLNAVLTHPEVTAFEIGLTDAALSLAVVKLIASSFPGYDFSRVKMVWHRRSFSLIAERPPIEQPNSGLVPVSSGSAI